MAREKKQATVNFRTQPALRESFETAFEQQQAYSNITAFFEDCMRGLVTAVRTKQKIEPPLHFVTKE
jgi:hypothetical protein